MAGIVRITRGQLRGIVVEEARRLAEAPKKKKAGGKGKKKAPAKKQTFEEWRNELDKVLDETGYGSISDTPAFDHLSSENQAAADAAEEILRTLYDAGTSEQDAAEALDAGDRFWEDHGYDVDALAAEDREDDEDGGHDTGEDESALEDESNERILGDLMNGYVTGVGMDREKLEDHLRRLGATPEEVDTIMDAAARLEAAYSEASASPEEHNQADWDEAEADITAAFEALGVTASLSDMNVHFPIEMWEEGLADKEEDDEDIGPLTWEEVLERFEGVDENVPTELQADIDAGRADFTVDDTLRADGRTKTWTWNDVDGWRLEKDHAQR